MGSVNFLMYVVGGLLVVGGLVMLFFETGLDMWVPAGIALAGLVILVGLLVVGLSNRVTPVPRMEHVEHRDVDHGRHRDDRARTAPPEQIMTERNVERETSPGRSRVHTSTRTTRRTTRRTDEPRDH